MKGGEWVADCSPSDAVPIRSGGLMATGVRLWIWENLLMSDDDAVPFGVVSVVVVAVFVLIRVRATGTQSTQLETRWAHHLLH